MKMMKKGLLFAVLSMIGVNIFAARKDKAVSKCVLNALHTDCMIPGSYPCPPRVWQTATSADDIINHCKDQGVTINTRTELIIYSESYECPYGPDCLFKLKKLGFKNCKCYCGGMNEWYYQASERERRKFGPCATRHSQYLAQPIGPPCQFDVPEATMDEVRAALH